MIHSTAIISPKAELGSDVSVGPYTIVYDNVVIGDGSTIEAYCEIGYPTKLAREMPLRIGKGSLIRSHSIFYQGSTIGDNLVTGHRVTVREGVRAGRDLQIGTLSDFQGDCELGDYVRTHSSVHIGKHSLVGNFVWLYPFVVLTNDPHPPSDYAIGVVVEDYAVVATMSVVLPGVRVGTHSLVAAHSLVRADVLPGEVVAGSPARKICDASSIELKDGSGGQAYPWPRHFHRGYPQSVVEEWNYTYGE